MGIAATSSLPLRVTRSGELTPWKNAATAYAVRNGVFAALLAGEGMIGPGNAFEGRNGLWENVTGPFELLAFPNKGGEPLTPKVQIKYWPVETNGQPVIFAAIKLRDRVKPHDLKAIEARMRQIVESKVRAICLLALSDGGRPSYNHDLARELTTLGVPCFGCTPKLLVHVMERVLKKQDLEPLLAAAAAGK